MAEAGTKLADRSARGMATSQAALVGDGIPSRLARVPVAQNSMSVAARLVPRWPVCLGGSLTLHTDLSRTVGAQLAQKSFKLVVHNDGPPVPRKMPAELTERIVSCAPGPLARTVVSVGRRHSGRLPASPRTERHPGIFDAYRPGRIQLDGLAWHFDRGLPVCGKCIPFVLFGPSGVFLLAGSRGQWTSDDLASMSAAADAIGSVMPGYASPIRTVLVIIGDHQAPRQHFTGIGEGPCWVLGEGWLLPWLYRFRDHGLAEPDIARLRGMADASVLRERRRTVIPSRHG